MKNKKLTKFLVPLLMVMALAFNINKAEAQSTCASAVVITPSTTYQGNSYSINDTVYWFRFTATDTAIIANAINKVGNLFADITSISLYRGSCAALTLIQTRGLNDSLTIGQGGLTIGNYYFVKIKRTAVNNGSFWFGYQNVIMVGQPLVCLPNCHEKISNGDFESFHYSGFSSSSAFGPLSATQCDPWVETASVCGWTRANGTPNLVDGANHAGRFWAGTPDNPISVTDTVSESLRNVFHNTLIPGNYILSFKYKIEQTNNPLWPSPAETLDRLIIRLTSFNAFDPLCNASGSPIMPTWPANNDWYLHIDNIVPNTGLYTNYSMPITVSSAQTTLSSIIFYASSTTAATSNEHLYFHLIDIDEVSLVPVYETNHNYTICSGQSQTLTPTLTGYDPYTYLWSNGATTSTIAVAPITNTTYYCTVTDAQPCPLVSTFNVNTLPAPPAFIAGQGFNGVITSGPYTTCSTYFIWYTINPYNSAFTYTGTLVGYDGNTIGPFPINAQNFNVNWNILPGGGHVIVTCTGSNGCSTTTSFDVYTCCTQAYNLSYNCATININTTPPSGSTITINGFLNINPLTVPPYTPSTLDLVNCNVYLGNNAKINIAPGCTLKLKDCILQACDTIMWNGIYVNSTTSLTGLVDVSRSTIKDAMNSIVSVNGGKFTIMSSTLRDNYKHIWVKPFYNAHAGTIKQSTLTNNVVQHLLYPVKLLRTNIGIQIDTVKSIIIGDSVAALNRNVFDFMDYGIKIKDSYVRVHNNKFTHIVSTGTSSGPTVLPFYAIYSQAINTNLLLPTAKVKIGDASGSVLAPNLFEECENGVYTVDNKYVNISGNKFVNTITTNNWGEGISVNYLNQSTSPVLIKLDTVNGYRKGIAVRSSDAATINCNLINLQAPNTMDISFRCRGIYIDLSHSTSMQVNKIYGPTPWNGDVRIEGISANTSSGVNMSCNNVYNTGRAIICAGVMNSSTFVRKNRLENATDGICLSSCIIGAQGSPSAASDNTWYGTYIHGYTYSLNTIGTNSPFYVRNYAGLPYNPTSVPMNPYFPTYAPFAPISIITTSWANNYTCPTCAGPPPPLNGASTSAEDGSTSMLFANDIIAGNINLPLYNDENKWLSKFELYKDVLINNTPTTGSLTTFMQTSNNNEIGKLYQVNNLLNNGNTALANSFNNNIITTEKMAGKLKEYYSLESNYCNNVNKYNVTGIDKDNLFAIAILCPYEYGPAVYQARTYLRANGDTRNYENECENTNTANNQKISNNNNGSNEVNTNSYIAIYPNPANESITLETALPTNSQGMVEIFDTRGVKVATNKLNEGNNNINIDLRNLNNGIYIYKVIVNGEVKKSDKIIVIH